MTEPGASPVWLSIDLRLGSTRLPMRLSVRADNKIEVDVGDPAVSQVLFTMLSADDLQELITMLEIAHGAALPLPEETSSGN